MCVLVPVGAEWGMDGAYPSLQILSLRNTSGRYGNLNGYLPAEWGVNMSLPSLEFLDLSSNLLKGVLPDSWGGQLTLEYLNLSSNAYLGGECQPPCWLRQMPSHTSQHHCLPVAQIPFLH